MKASPAAVPAPASTTLSLRWTKRNETLRDDLDFRWHYELLSPKAKEGLKEVLAGAHAPYPVAAQPVNEERALALMIGGGMNCVFTRYDDAEFDL